MIVSRLILACTILFVAGCGNIGENATISGTVECDGAPLPDGVVVFTSDSTTCSGKIQDGKYQVLSQGKKSVPLQEYVVTIFPPDNEVEYNPETHSEEPVVSTVDLTLFPEKYQSGSTSGLKFSPVQGSNQFDITLNKDQ